MRRPIRKVFVTRSHEFPEDRVSQNKWIETTHKEWQSYWHDLFDADTSLIASGEFSRPESLPDDVRCDFRLIFGLSRATPKTQRRCFELFPNGAEMHRRFSTFLSSTSHSFSEAEALSQLTRVTALIEAIGPNENVDFTKTKVVRGDNEEGRIELSNTDCITVLLEKDFLSPHPVDKLPSIAAQLFLTEPLYAAAGHFYQLTNWVTAAMSESLIDDLHKELYELWRGGWEVLLGQEIVLFAYRSV
ncbi:MAG: hypothetical protein P8X51_09400 [Maritimibacter sp.]